MLQMKTIVNVADNTGARKASLIGVLRGKGRRIAHIGDIVRVNTETGMYIERMEKAK